jgi:glycosyltransferase involved in cell wall biosynthesis
MQKVLHVVEAFAGGVQTFLLELTNYQCNEFDVYIAYSIRPQTPKDFKDDFDKRIHWILVENFQSSIGIKDIKAFFELKHIIREIKPDIVHLHSSKAGALGRWAFNCSKHKVFYTPHAFAFLIQDASKLKRKLYWFIEYISAQRKAVTIACGKGEYDESMKLSQRCTYASNSISIYNLNPFLKEKRELNVTPTVCGSGRLTYQKNPLLFNQIAQLLPQVRFVWVGDGELKNELTSPNIEITGWKTRETALEYLFNSDFFLLPSLWEGMPFSLLEAMYIKKICLVSDVIGNRDAIENERNGFICRSAEEFASRITQVIEGKRDWIAMTEQAQKDIITSYNTDTMAAKYREIYNTKF